ncbi:2TM domain-containing protein [Peribacillus sp. FSL E2-0159]
MENGDGYLRAKKRAENLKAFYIHIIVYVLVVPLSPWRVGD